MEYYLYHKIPVHMEGTKIHPLNILKQENARLYKLYTKKYEGREELMDATIPFLNNCLWNDVVFLVAVNPIEIHKSWVAEGFPPFGHIKGYYKINVKDLDHSKLAVYFPDGKSAWPTKVCQEFNLDDYEKYSEMSIEQIEYYRSRKRDDGKGMIFIYNRLPHILYKGTIDVSQCDIVEIKS